MYSIVPIQNIPNNRFSSKIPVDGQNLTLIFYVTYNELAKYWLIDISNADGTMLISGLPVVPAQNILVPVYADWQRLYLAAVQSQRTVAVGRHAVNGLVFDLE